MSTELSDIENPVLVPILRVAITDDRQSSCAKHLQICDRVVNATVCIEHVETVTTE